MAIRELGVPQAPQEVARLKETVCAELRRPDSQAASAGAPVVLREREGVPPLNHYYVVWDGFQGYSPEIRSSVVYESILECLGKTEALNTTIVMGLTVEEARNMGLQV
jgi:hypothetical protein